MCEKLGGSPILFEPKLHLPGQVGRQMLFFVEGYVTDDGALHALQAQAISMLWDMKHLDILHYLDRGSLGYTAIR